MNAAMYLIIGSAAYVLAISSLTYVLYAFDKLQARAGGWRISESTLLFVALIGGSIGAKTAQHRLRHKTRKEPFRTQLNLICAVHVACLLSMTVPSIRGKALDLTEDLVMVIFEYAAFQGNSLPHRFGPGS